MELGTGTSDKARLEWECHTVSLFVAWGLRSTPLHSFLEVFRCSRPMGCLPISPTIHARISAEIDHLPHFLCRRTPKLNARAA